MILRCHGDMRKPTGPTVFTMFSSVIIGVFAANIVFYLGVWVAIVKTSKQLQVRTFERFKHIHMCAVKHKHRNLHLNFASTGLHIFG